MTRTPDPSLHYPGEQGHVGATISGCPACRAAGRRPGDGRTQQKIERARAEPIININIPITHHALCVVKPDHNAETHCFCDGKGTLDMGAVLTWNYAICTAALAAEKGASPDEILALRKNLP